MATIRGRPKKQIGFKILPDLQDKINFLIDSGKFPSQASVVEAALREFFVREWVDERIRLFLLSQEGRELIRKISEEKD